MKLTLRATALIVLLLVAATIASANSVSLTLNNGGNDVMGGVYVGPYNFTTGSGQSLQLICDDFKDEVYPGESWTAITSTFPSLSNVVPLGTQTQYEEVAWLVEQMSQNMGNPTTVGEIQWAIWAVFDPSILTPGGDPYGSISPYLTGIDGWLDQAEMPSNYANGNYSNLTIYTPASDPAGYGPPQEYVGVPEPSSLALLVTGMLALMLLVIRRGRA